MAPVKNLTGHFVHIACVADALNLLYINGLDECVDRLRSQGTVQYFRAAHTEQIGMKALSRGFSGYDQLIKSANTRIRCRVCLT